MEKFLFNFQHSVRGGYYAAPNYDVIHDVSVLFTSAKVEVILFDTMFYLRPKFSILHISKYANKFCILIRSQRKLLVSD